MDQWARHGAELGVWDHDIVTGKIVWSPQLEKMLGLPPGGFSGTIEALISHVHPDDRRALQDTLTENTHHGAHHVQLRMLRADGHIVWTESYSTTFSDAAGRPVRSVGVVADVTERVRAEEALRSKERQQAAVARLGQHALEPRELRAVLDEAVEAAAYTMDADLVGLLELVPGGRSFRVLAGHGWREGLVGSEIPIEVGTLAATTLRRKEPILVDDLPSDERFCGSSVLHEHHAISAVSIVVGEPERPVGVFAAFRTRRASFTLDDVHFVQGVANVLAATIERRRSETRLARSEARLHLVLRALPVGVWLTDPAGRIVLSNTEAQRIWGGEPASELKGWWVDSGRRLEPEDWGGARAVQQGETSFGELIEIQGLDGAKRTILHSAMPLLDENGGLLGAVVVHKDVTERQVLEQQFRQAQKMEAMGRLAGGVAHDFNNLLSVILGYSELVRNGLPEDSPQRDKLGQIQRAADRAAELTRQLLAFSRKQTAQPRVLELNARVTDMEKMLRRLIGEDVELRTKLAPGIGRVRIDPGQLEQIVLNLAVNARDAMPTGGRLTLETASAEFDDAYVRRHPAAQCGRYSLLAVSDTGVGMDEKTRAQLFEPFFTTKEPGRGTGLGLATVYGIVKQNGGFIWVYSEPGLGSTFKLYLPEVRSAVEEPLARPRVGPAPQGRGERVLVVEDEPGVRELVKQSLHGAGYVVLEAGDPASALRLLAGGQTVELVISDVVMPGMSGPQLAHRLAAEHAKVPVLFTSGYTQDALGQHGILDAQLAFIPKPFTPHQLLVKVRETLDAPLGSPLPAAPETASDRRA
ncbi:MAG TPA: response regulator [Candidatus Polarisedimenticolaceae bacterium]|nr:response regulator [Candidatus Polarisedimenticolaceae bacterium]